MFVFHSGDGSMSSMNSTGIADYTDGVDKIAYNNGLSYLSNPFAGGQLTTQNVAGGNAVQEVSSSRYLFYVSGSVTFDDNDVTTDVTV